MTPRPRFFLPVLALPLAALMTLGVAPAVARADTLTWFQTYSSPQSHTVNEAEVGIGAAFNAVSFSGSSGWVVGVIKDKRHHRDLRVADRALRERRRDVESGDGHPGHDR